jgi:hypothetical protein
MSRLRTIAAHQPARRRWVGDVMPLCDTSGVAATVLPADLSPARLIEGWRLRRPTQHRPGSGPQAGAGRADPAGGRGKRTGARSGRTSAATGRGRPRMAVPPPTGRWVLWSRKIGAGAARQLCLNIYSVAKSLVPLHVGTGSKGFRPMTKTATTEDRVARGFPPPAPPA